MGLFGKPRCPYCGNKTIVPTGYSFPFKQYRCTYCYDKNMKLSKMQDEIDELKKQAKSK